MSNRFKNKLDKMLAAAHLKKGYKPKYEHITGHSWTVDEINLMADKMLEWFKLDKNYWLKDFAISMDVPYRNFKESFCEKSEYFKHIFKHCKDIQESKLVRLGMNTRSSMPIFALKNVAGWRDKQEHDVKILDKESARKAIEELFE